MLWQYATIYSIKSVSENGSKQGWKIRMSEDPAEVFNLKTQSAPAAEFLSSSKIIENLLKLSNHSHRKMMKVIDLYKPSYL